jgi:hypothetical protein
MPLSDLADYDGDFFLANIDMSFRAKTETPWGKVIPEEIFLHYVLPCRVNNENLDSFRIVYYDELLDRVRGKDIREAALEINHWCHEKVSYQPADIRTSAPMSTIALSKRKMWRRIDIHCSSPQNSWNTRPSGVYSTLGS